MPLSDDFLQLIRQPVMVNLPLYRINEYRAHISKKILGDYKCPEARVMMKILLDLYHEYEDKWTINPKDLMGLSTENFNSMIMLMIYCRNHYETVQSQFGSNFFIALKALYIDEPVDLKG